VVLDWVSFVEPYAPFGITPRNPNTGLSFVLILLFGQRMIPLLFLAPFGRLSMAELGSLAKSRIAELRSKLHRRPTA
jgi:hypothetical protein